MNDLTRSLLVLLNFLHFIQGNNILPALDVIENGFDLPYISNRAKIFDLENEEKSSVYLPTMSKSFTYPSFLSVISHGQNSKRVEKACTGIFKKFSSYCHYLSFSIDVNVGIKQAYWSLNAGAHFGLKKVKTAIDKKHQEIGVSDSWWGIYEVHMPPGFLLASKLSKSLKQSIEMINKIGTPKTESDQHIYNEICCGKSGFGTHYVSSVIAGGHSRMTSFINSSYHTSHSIDTIEAKIEINFEYMKMKLSGRSKFNTTTDKNSTTFRRNTKSIVTYQPDVTKLHGNKKAPWNAWEEAVLENPVAVNKSLSPITDLFTGNPKARKHMERTIKFYLDNNGKAPKLSDVRAVNSFGAVPPPKKNNLVPGLDVVGCGFDATTLTTKNSLFKKPVSNLPTSTWSNPYYPNISYTIPFGYYAKNKPVSEALNGTVFINSVDDLVRKSKLYERTHDGGFLGFGSRDVSKVTKRYYRMFYAHNYVLALTQRQVSWYSLNLLEFPLLEFSDPFKKALDYLPSVYNPNDKSHASLAALFFKSYGTDVVLSVDMGGMVWEEHFFEKCLTKIYSDTCITTEITRGWWLEHKHQASTECPEKKVKKDFKSNSMHYFGRTGGSKGKTPLKQSEWDKWVLSIKDNPRPVRHALGPIYYLLSDSHPKKTALIMATQDFLKRSDTKRKSIIDSLQIIRPPPASVCKKKEEKEKGTAKNSASRFINMFARPLPNTNSKGFNPCDMLCPFVGFFGVSCPCKYRKPVSFANALRHRTLPRGVGVTIDITTGQLKLPAINYVNSPNSWVDVLSGIVYSIPYDVSLSIEGFPHTPSIRVFNTVEELAKVWEDGYKDGKWLGGEFGERKSIIDLYTKFFSKYQKTSISQNPHTLYNLTLHNGWENKLNQFVIKSLRSLPKKYNSNIYSRFMDTWGTHVATKTLIGGMTEQQVTMKSCISKRSSSAKGLTDVELKKYLNMDLRQVPVHSPFYSERRKMSISHRIGGNPEIKNETQWFRSLSENPVLIKIHESIDWSNVVRNGNITSNAVAQNLVRALVERMRTKEKIAQQEYKEVKELMKKRSQTKNCPPYTK